MGTIGTTAKLIFSGNQADPVSFRFHADSGNGAAIRVSSSDPNVLSDFEEYNAGEGESFEDFVGQLYAISVSGTLVYALTYVQYRSQSSLGLGKV